MGQQSPSPRAGKAPGGPQPRRFCCFSGFGSSPHGRQLPAPTAACSLCIVRAREQKEGPREKREQEIIRIDGKKKKRQSLQRLQLGFRETYTCCLQTPAPLPHRKYLHATERHESELRTQPALAVPRTPGPVPSTQLTPSWGDRAGVLPSAEPPPA